MSTHVDTAPEVQYWRHTRVSANCTTSTLRALSAEAQAAETMGLKRVPRSGGV